jgi:hypothetical protein
MVPDICLGFEPACGATSHGVRYLHTHFERNPACCLSQDVHRSDDGGKSWRRVVSYATSPQHLRGLALARGVD